MAGNETDALLAMMPFAAVLGIEEVTALPEQVTGRVRWDESRCTSFGVLHGGVLMSLADSIATSRPAPPAPPPPAPPPQNKKKKNTPPPPPPPPAAGGGGGGGPPPPWG